MHHHLKADWSSLYDVLWEFEIATLDYDAMPPRDWTLLAAEQLPSAYEGDDRLSLHWAEDPARSWEISTYHLAGTIAEIHAPEVRKLLRWSTVGNIQVLDGSIQLSVFPDTRGRGETIV